MYEIHFKELAEIAHVSAGHLSRLFSKDTGSSFSEYLITFRMNKAIELMTKQDAACVEAANFVGYTDYAQFSKIFKKYTGVSPNYYKT
ncbi:helix-turn-helix domain-containing protein [Propionispira arboris]|uniref:helix-turn-helix domain-containing protein n=2 Tax=Propionispira TaxID=84034 RepID=UPI001FDF65D2